MTSLELRNKIQKELESVEDYLLEEIISLIESETKEDTIVQIPNHYKKSLEKSISQKNVEDTIPNDEVEKHIEGWLYK